MRKWVVIYLLLSTYEVSASEPSSSSFSSHLAGLSSLGTPAAAQNTSRCCPTHRKRLSTPFAHVASFTQPPTRRPCSPQPVGFTVPESLSATYRRQMEARAAVAGRDPQAVYRCGREQRAKHQGCATETRKACLDAGCRRMTQRPAMGKRRLSDLLAAGDRDRRARERRVD
ncbi:uncharacterized protein LOC130981463 [Arachis stenosperma]|uniref:uncharacterized protein LOC130981463 n=1 Tax=Arachis stenosperma TaxID=217475 RepID=UPI0025AD5DF9|nr:uncharacterized protein LOC130981463 [Arachis stenosperma]